MKKTLLLFYTLLFSFISSEAQDFSKNYTPLKSVGEVPEELKRLSSEKYEQRKEGFKDDKRKTRKTKEEFVLQSTFAIDELLLSGDVFFNDTIGKYINSIADELLKEDKALREKLNFYLVKSNYVNAFATERGAIFITLGLMAKLKNEAELAFILAHEIIHYKKNHLINGYLESNRIEKGEGEYKNQSAKNILLSSSNYSKDLELEADQEGFDLFAKSSYAIDAAYSVMEVLKFSAYPFEEATISFDFLNKDNFTFPESYFSDTIVPIEIDEDADDSESTHPNIKKRKELITLYLDNETKTRENNLFVISESQFYYCRELARFELVNNYTAQLDYAMGFYCNYIMQQKYPENEFLKKNMAYTFYAMAKYKSNNKDELVIRKDKDWQGKFLIPLQFLNNVKDEELSALAISYIYEIYKEHKDDTFLKSIMNDAFITLIKDDNKTLDYYLDKNQKEAVFNAYADSILINPYEGVDTINLSNIELKRLKRTIKHRRRDLDKSVYYDRFIFAHLLADNEFTSLFKQAEEEVSALNEVSKFSENQNNRYQRKKNKHGVSLGIDRIVFADPYYHKFDERKEIQSKYIQSEKNQLAFREDILKVADKLKIETEILGQQELLENKIGKLNDISLLNNWLAEKSAHDWIEIIPYNSQFIEQLTKKYNSDYFAWLGVIGTKSKASINLSWLVISAYTIVGLPIYFGSLLIPENNTLYYAVVVDLKKGKILIQNYEFVENKDSNDLIRSQIYQTLLQIKRKKDYTR